MFGSREYTPVSAAGLCTAVPFRISDVINKTSVCGKLQTRHQSTCLCFPLGKSESTWLRSELLKEEEEQEQEQEREEQEEQEEKQQQQQQHQQQQQQGNKKKKKKIKAFPLVNIEGNEACRCKDFHCL